MWFLLYKTQKEDNADFEKSWSTPIKALQKEMCMEYAKLEVREIPVPKGELAYA